MTQDVTLPLWLLILILLFASVTFASHFLFPSVRWFFRKRMERVVAKINARLPRPIEPFKLLDKSNKVQSLVYDPVVVEAVVAHAQRNKVPQEVAFARARAYAREILPSFSPRTYFTWGTGLARWLSRSLYRVRVGGKAEAQFERLDPNSTVVYVINHRSNMDYVLVTYLVSRSVAVSYAVGEWARVWPLSQLIRAMGAYFIRRKSRGVLYRKVLERYVQMASEGGVTQAFFPEGGLSLDGRLAQPKLGLLSYQVENWQPSARNIIFVPVAINYDRILEDRFLVAAEKSGVRKFRPPLLRGAVAVGRHLLLRMTWRFRGFGSATVAFGVPLSLKEFAPEGGVGRTQEIAQVLMARIAAVMPILPVPLVARVLLREGALSRAELATALEAELALLRDTEALSLRRPPEEVAADALSVLFERRMVKEQEGQLLIRPEDRDLLAFYAASLDHHFGEGPAVSGAPQVFENEHQKLLVS